MPAPCCPPAMLPLTPLPPALRCRATHPLGRPPRPCRAAGTRARTAGCTARCARPWTRRCAAARPARSRGAHPPGSARCCTAPAGRQASVREGRGCTRARRGCATWLVQDGACTERGGGGGPLPRPLAQDLPRRAAADMVCAVGAVHACPPYGSMELHGRRAALHRTAACSVGAIPYPHGGAEGLERMVDPYARGRTRWPFAIFLQAQRTAHHPWSLVAPQL